MIRFVLTGQLPSGKNAVIVTRSGMRFPAKRFKLWREDAFKQLAVVGNLQVPAEWEPLVMVWYTPGDKRRRDVPGMVDALWHLMEKFGMVDDDARFKNIRWVTNPVEKGKAMVEVEIVNL